MELVVVVVLVLVVLVVVVVELASCLKAWMLEMIEQERAEKS